MSEDEARFRVETGREPTDFDRAIGFNYIPYQTEEFTEEENQALEIMNNPDREQIVANMSEEERRNFTALEQSVKNKELYNQSIDLQKEMNDIDRAEFDAGVPMWDKDTIEINGVERAVTNSSGKKIAYSEKSLRMFYEWFGDSKVVDADGRPLVVRHTTNAKFDTFDKSKIGQYSGNYGFYGAGFYFAPTTDTHYADFGNIQMYVYLKMENPFMITPETNYNEIKEYTGNDRAYDKYQDWRENIENTIAGFEMDFSENLEDAGYDGVWFKENDSNVEIVAFSPNQIKSTSNRGTFSKASDNIRYQFGGPSARTAALDKLDIAKKALENGYPKEEIRQLTGWFQGADGKWRFEISDKDAVINEDYGVDKVNKMKWYDMPFALRNVLHHDKLYEAYPELGRIRVIYTNRLEQEASGNYDYSINTIYLNAKESQEKLKSVLMHEVQHAIQHKEGFARGGNTEEFIDRTRQKELEGELNRLEQLAEQGEDVEDEIAQVQYELGEYSDDIVFDKYKHLAGEIEARNTQTRMNMSEEERLARSPESTQDYSSDEAIIVFDDGTVANSYTYKPENVRIENGVVDLTGAFEGIPTQKDVEDFINKAIEEGTKFGTLSPDFFFDMPTRRKAIDKLKNNNNYKKLSDEEQERLYKYILALEKIAENTKQLPPPEGVENKKTRKKPMVERYFYFGAKVNTGGGVFDIVFDAEKNKRDSSKKPLTVHLYNIEEVDNGHGAYTHDSKVLSTSSTSNITPSGRDVNSPRYQTEEYDEQLEADLAEFDKILDSFTEENKEYYSKKGKFEDAKKIQKKYKDFFMYNIADASVSTALHDPFYFEYDGQKDITNIWIPKKLEKNSNIILYRYAEQISIPVNKFEKSKFKKLGFKRQKLYDEGMRDIYTLNKEEKSDDARDFVRENGKYIRKPSAYYQTAYAGSRVDYDKPSLEAIGTGEGQQAHGWGLYYALSRDTAERYREYFDLDNYFFDEEALENERAKAEKEAGKTKDYSKVELLEDLLVQHNESNLSNYPEDLVEWYNKNIRSKVLNKDYKKTQVHEVELPENPYLLDEQKTFEEQSDFVKQKLEEIFSNLPEEYLKEYPKMGIERVKEIQFLGSEIYGALSEAYGSDKEASLLLNKYGIKGITYDGEQDGRCFVIFNPKDVKVIQKFYQIQEYDDLRSTKSVSDVKKLLRGLSPDEEVRLMFDKNKGYWFAIDAQNYVHQDMITKAFEQGLYPEFRNSYEAQQYFDENYNADDEYLVRFKAHNFIDENDLQKLLDENIPYDEYKYGYAVKNNDGSGYVLFARSLYDLADTPLKSIGIDAEIWERNPYNMTEFSKVSGQELERNGIRYMAESGGGINLEVGGGRKLLKPYKRHPLKVMGQYEPTKKMITLFKGRNPTTLVHEMGHHYLPIHLRLLEKAGKWDKLKPLYKELGISSVEQMNREAEEKLIDMFTSYIYYNEAPNVETQSIFERAKQWMINAYNTVKNFVKPSEEVTKFFDELIAGEENAPDVSHKNKNRSFYERFFAKIMYIYFLKVPTNSILFIYTIFSSFRCCNYTGKSGPPSRR